MAENESQPTTAETLHKWLVEYQIYSWLETQRQKQQQAIVADPARQPELELINTGTRRLSEMPACLNLPSLMYTPEGYTVLQRYVTVHQASGKTFIMPHCFFWDFQQKQLLCLTPFQFAYHIKPTEVEFSQPGDATEYMIERAKGTDIQFIHTPDQNAAMLATVTAVASAYGVEYI